MERVQKIAYKEKEIILIDYTNCKEAEMIELLITVKQLILTESKEVLVLSKFNEKTFITPNYVKRLETELKEVDNLLKKNTVIGLSKIQLWIVKGINLWYRKKIHHFETEQQALDYLVE